MTASGARQRAAIELDGDEWRRRAAEHVRRADAFTAGWRDRRPRGEPHAVEDFLFTYYPVKPSRLRVWHPGAGVMLHEAAERARWSGYRDAGDGAVTVDGRGLVADGAAVIGRIEAILRGARDRPARFGCFGLHEWAMVYRQDPQQLRHSSLPLRLGREGTDRVVESHRITCTHFDAFRFFTPQAEPLNTLRPTRETQAQLEQQGCLHANMDLYRWAARLGPLVPGELLLDAFDLARDARVLDMRASPYDLSSYGLTAVAIETAQGKREYAAAQRELAGRADGLRARLLAAIDLARQM